MENLFHTDEVAGASPDFLSEWAAVVEGPARNRKRTSELGTYHSLNLAAKTGMAKKCCPLLGTRPECSGSRRSVSGLAATGSDVHDDGTLRPFSPQAITAEERVVIAAELRAGRHLFEFFGVSAAQDHVVGAKALGEFQPGRAGAGADHPGGGT